jgi:hypothetical protein
MSKIKFSLCIVMAVMIVVVPLPWHPASARAVPSTPAKPPVTHRAERGHVLNSHLHGVKPIKSAEARKGFHHARYWVGRWAYGNWVGLHRGYGAITGNVQSGGRAVGGAEVLLVSTRGRAIREKHLTHTTVGGGYIMRRVRAGSYHVKAVMGERVGHSPIHLYSGTIVAVPIKI